jgi:Ca2+-binding EF-hand superfamily protein
MRQLTLSLMAATAALTAGAAASAQPAPAPQQHEMTRAAVEQRSAQAFGRLDGKLDQADRAERQKARFERVDANHDGSVSYAEFAAMQAQRDGARRQHLARGGEQPGDRAGRQGHRAGHRFAMRGFAGRGGMIRMADANKDGAITQAEFQAAALSRFDRLDANRDGTVTRDEAKAARDNMRQRWQARREARAG